MPDEASLRNTIDRIRQAKFFLDQYRAAEYIQEKLFHLSAAYVFARSIWHVAKNDVARSSGQLDGWWKSVEKEFDQKSWPGHIRKLRDKDLKEGLIIPQFEIPHPKGHVERGQFKKSTVVYWGKTSEGEQMKGEVDLKPLSEGIEIVPVIDQCLEDWTKAVNKEGWIMMEQLERPHSNAAD